MTESGKVHSNFTSIIIAIFQETVKHQSLRNCGGCLLFFCVTLWHMSIIDGYNVALNKPYDYTINATCEHPMTESRIEEIAEESNAVITA